MSSPDPADTGERWGWVFWLLLAAAVTPFGAVVASVQSVLADEDLVDNYPIGNGMPREFADDWNTVTVMVAVGWPSLTTALGLLVLTAVVLSGRPRWLVVPAGRAALGGVAAVSAAGAVLAMALTLWTLLGDPTPRQIAATTQGWNPTTFADWSLEGSALLLAFFVQLCVVVVLVSTRPSHVRVVEDPSEGSEAE